MRNFYFRCRNLSHRQAQPVKLLSVLLPLLFGLSSAKSHAILDGIKAQKSDQAWQYTARLILTKKDYGVATCTGVLIREDALLTAAHCLKDIIGVQVNLVEVGGSALYKSHLLKYEPHPDYKPRNQPISTPLGQSTAAVLNAESGQLVFFTDAHKYYVDHYTKQSKGIFNSLSSFSDKVKAERRPDIGIIVLDTPVQAPFKPIDIWNAEPDRELRFGDTLFSFGHGYYGLQGQKDESLRYTDVQLVGYLGDAQSPDQLAAFSMNRYGLSEGDSGGPVVIRENNVDYLVGINATVGGDGHMTFVVVQKFLDWFELAIDSLEKN